MTISKTKTNEIKLSGNTDGVDHSQDQFILWINPVVPIRLAGKNVEWNLAYSGTFPTLQVATVYQLQHPATLPQVFRDLHFTASDYQQILAQDPFANGSTTIDTNRFIPTTFQAAYDPAPTQPNCNNGVCNCMAWSGSIKNEYQDDTSHGAQTQYSASASLTAGPGELNLGDLGLELNFKESWDFTWTNSTTTTNLTGSSQSASVTILCPSPGYSGPENVGVYWDTLYGSFMFQLYEPTADQIIQKGQITNAVGKPVSGQLVELSYGGKTYHTVTGAQGNYRFFTMSKPAAGHVPATGQLSVRNIRQQVRLADPLPVQIHLR